MSTQIPNATTRKAMQLEQSMTATFHQAQLYIQKITTELEAFSATFEEETNAEQALLESGDEQTRAYLTRERTEEEEHVCDQHARLVVNLDNILSILKTGTPSVYPRSFCQSQMLVSMSPGSPYISLPLSGEC